MVGSRKMIDELIKRLDSLDIRSEETDNKIEACKLRLLQEIVGELKNITYGINLLQKKYVDSQFKPVKISNHDKVKAEMESLTNTDPIKLPTVQRKSAEEIIKAFKDLKIREGHPDDIQVKLFLTSERYGEVNDYLKSEGYTWISSGKDSRWSRKEKS